MIPRRKNSQYEFRIIKVWYREHGHVPAANISHRLRPHPTKNVNVGADYFLWDGLLVYVLSNTL